MSHPRIGSSGMGYERKRGNGLASINTSDDPSQASSSSSAFSRPAYNMSQGPHGQAPPRSPSPPASAYFPLLSDDRLRPVPNAESHFAYSTTLRRHHADATLGSPSDIAHVVEAEASSLWSKAVALVTGQPPEGAVENGRLSPKPPQREERRDTVSARFAHYSVEVSFTLT